MLRKKHDKTFSFHSNLPELAIRSTQKKVRSYPSKRIEKSRSQVQTSIKSLDISCFLSQSKHNLTQAKNRRSSLFARNYRKKWAYKSRTLANMKSDLEKLNTIFDMYKKIIESIQLFKINYC